MEHRGSQVYFKFLKRCTATIVIDYCVAFGLLLTDALASSTCPSRSYAIVHPSWTHYSQTHRGPSARYGALFLPCATRPGAGCVPQQEFPPRPRAEAPPRGGPPGEPPNVRAAVPASQPGGPVSRIRRILTVFSHRREPHV